MYSSTREEVAVAEVVSARRTHTRDKLVDAAIVTFAEKGVLGASVEEICDTAGFTRGAFYSNFDGKDALCLAILARQASAQLEASHQAIASLADADAGLDGLVGHAIAVFLGTQRRDRASLLAMAELRLYAVREESFRAGYLAFFERVTREFVELIERTASEFGYRLTVPGTQAIAVLQGVYEQSAIASLLAGEQGDAPDRAALLAGVLKSMLEEA